MLNNGYKGAHEDGEKLATMWSKTDTMNRVRTGPGKSWKVLKL